MILADGTKTIPEVYGIAVGLDGQSKEAFAHASDTTPLIGISLLHRHNLNGGLVDGGRVFKHPSEGCELETVTRSEWLPGACGGGTRLTRRTP